VVSARVSRLRLQRGAIGVALAASIALAHATPAQPLLCSHGGDAFVRTELYFGLAQHNGAVSEQEFQRFVDTHITPRFPEGLTLIAATGQFRGRDGAVRAEDSKVLILLYPLRDAHAGARIDAIRRDYRTRYAQQSVLRADSMACASF
jgi:Protein of unknown function (DUF3574)